MVLSFYVCARLDIRVAYFDLFGSKRALTKVEPSLVSGRRPVSLAGIALSKDNMRMSTAWAKFFEVIYTHAPGKFTVVEFSRGEDDETTRGPFLQVASWMSTIGFRR